MHDPYSVTEKDAGYYLAHPIPTPPPPPEWEPKRHRKPWLFIVLTSLVVVVIVLLISVPLGWQYWLSVNHAKEPTSLPAMKSNYTVADIVTDITKDGCPCGKRTNCGDGGDVNTPITCQQSDKALIYGESIDAAFGSDYAIGIQAMDSATWADPPSNQWSNVGLWVYNSSLDAKSAHDAEMQQIYYEQSKTLPSPTIPTTVYLHGKCLLLIAPGPLPPWSGYQQDLNKYCI